ncbi:MAG: hypothetical protein Q8910_18480, partial [Bacteroidota bacterium]|nr:hypothetical protein [Bacteroidota bacterium]
APSHGMHFSQSRQVAKINENRTISNHFKLSQTISNYLKPPQTTSNPLNHLYPPCFHNSNE